MLDKSHQACYRIYRLESVVGVPLQVLVVILRPYEVMRWHLNSRYGQKGNIHGDVRQNIIHLNPEFLPALFAGIFAVCVSLTSKQAYGYAKD